MMGSSCYWIKQDMFYTSGIQGPTDEKEKDKNSQQPLKQLAVRVVLTESLDADVPALLSHLCPVIVSLGVHGDFWLV